jgi:hypothetical protein
VALNNFEVLVSASQPGRIRSSYYLYERRRIVELKGKYILLFMVKGKGEGGREGRRREGKEEEKEK